MSTFAQTTHKVVKVADTPPVYKDYRNFLNTYKKKSVEDNQSIRSNDSGVSIRSYSLTPPSNNTSSSSLNSDVTDYSRKGSYPQTMKPSNIQSDKNMFYEQDLENREIKKSELYIEVNGTENSVKNVSRLFESSTINKTVDLTAICKSTEECKSTSVNSVSKIFEGNSHPPVAPNYVTKSKLKTKEKVEEKKRSVSEVSKKFETKENINNKVTSSTLIRKNSLRRESDNQNNKINELTKLLQTNVMSNSVKSEVDIEVKPNINEISKVYENRVASPESEIHKEEVIVTHKLNINEVSKIFQETQQTSKQEIHIESKKIVVPSSSPIAKEDIDVHQKLNIDQLSKIFLESQVSSAPKQKIEGDMKKSDIPKVSQEKPQITAKPPQFLPKSPGSESNGSTVPVPPSPPSLGGDSIPPPPPPPLPPADSTPQKKITSIKVAPTATSTLGRRPSNQNRNEVDFGSMVKSNGEIDKDNPMVKKLVYGTLRNMYGAYHDKANEYVGTLPQSRVQKNNNIQNIINNIASQGGLEKLSGRANPAVDKE